MEKRRGASIEEFISLRGRERESERARSEKRERGGKKRKKQLTNNHWPFTISLSFSSSFLPQPLKKKKAIMQLSAARTVRPARSSTLKCSAIKAQTPYADELIATAVSEPRLGDETLPQTEEGSAIKRRRRVAVAAAFCFFSTFCSAAHSRSIAGSRPLLSRSLT